MKIAGEECIAPTGLGCSQGLSPSSPRHLTSVSKNRGVAKPPSERRKARKRHRCLLGIEIYFHLGENFIHSPFHSPKPWPREASIREAESVFYQILSFISPESESQPATHFCSPKRWHNEASIREGGGPLAVEGACASEELLIKYGYRAPTLDQF